jgi:hypothetical protein
VSLGVQSDQDRLTIRRWSTTCLLPSGHAAPEEFRARIHDLMNARLRDSCRDSILQVLPRDDSSVWRIRKLNLDLAFAMGDGTDDRIVRETGVRFAETVARVISSGEIGDQVLFFPNRAAFVAQFLFDLAAGRAWGKWYYVEFESLSSLPTHLAVTEALIREPGLCPRCIAGLAVSGKLEEVTQVLTERDAERIYQAAFDASEPEVGEHVGVWISRLLVLWGEAPLRPASQDEMRFRDGLRLLGRAALKFPEFHRDQGFKTALDCLLEIRRVAVAQHSPTDLVRLIHWLATGDIASGLSSARKSGVDPSVGLVRRRKSGVDPSVGLVRRRKSGVDPSVDLVRTFVATMDGDTHWAEQAIGVITREDSPGKAAAGVITNEDSRGKAAASGEAMYLSSFAGVFLLGPSLLKVRLGEISEAVTRSCDKPAQAGACFRQLILLKCLGRERARNAASDPAIRLLAGAENDFGVGAVQTKWNDFFDHDSKSAGAPNESLGLSLIRSMLTEDGDSVPDQLTSADEAYYSLADLWPEARLPHDLDAGCSLIANSIIRHFARRLFGFHSSSPEHLYQNFLAGTGALVVSADRLEVRLPRSPLTIILQLSGVANQTYAMPWLNGRNICLHLPSE